MVEVITFFSPSDPYFEFANFYPAAFTLDNKIWPTVEHYFQAQKTQLDEWKEKIRLAETPEECKKLGWDVPDYDDAHWLSLREGVMEKAVRAKFEQHDDLRELLLSTGDAILVEQSYEADQFWGMVNGKGKNKMGRLLMKLRFEFQ